jgi:hypothetical protein
VKTFLFIAYRCSLFAARGSFCEDNSALSIPFAELFLDSRSVREIAVEGFAVLEAAAQELRPVGNLGQGIGSLGEQSPQRGVMPTEFLTRTVAMGADARSQSLDLADERLTVEAVQVFVHLATLQLLDG